MNRRQVDRHSADRLTAGLGGLPIFSDGASLDGVQAALAERELTDGLPMAPPTLPRLLAMLGDEAAPDREMGLLPPLLGRMTPACVAYQCVIAGCSPSAFPIVLAASRAMLADEFNLLGLATTTGSAAVVTIVHGPIAERAGISGGADCLSASTSANAAIGRAVALILRNIGGAKPGVGDMATLGQPAKRGLCFAEADAAGCFPSLSERRGLGPSVSGVTMLGISGTLEVLPDDDRDTPETILAPMARVMATVFNATGAARQPQPPEQVFILPPELAAAIRGTGWDLDRVCRHLFDEGAAHADRPIAPDSRSIIPVVAGGAGIKMAYLPAWGGGTRMVTRRFE